MESQKQQQMRIQEVMQRLQLKRKNLKRWIRSALKTPERSTIRDILKIMNENDSITDDAEYFILDYIENAIINTTTNACRYARSRKSTTLEKKDIDYAIQLQILHRKKRSSSQNMEIPQYSSPEMEEIFSSVKEPKQEHLENLALLEST